MTLPISLSVKQLQVLRQTTAKDCNENEFNLFMEACKSYSLDPFRKQIIPIVFHKKNAEKRQLTIVVTRDGLRVMASRCGDYRPASEPARFVYDDNLKSETNPKGIISVSVKLWKQDNRGEWYPVIGEADWDEFAPIVEEWLYDESAGRRKKTGRNVLDKSGNWFKMPKVMIQKCAEAQALRSGWPETFNGVYVEEEIDRAKQIDLTASEELAQEEENRRIALTASKDSISIQWLPNMMIEPVNKGALTDRCLEWIEDPSRTLEQIEYFSSVNKHSLSSFWAREPNESLEIKKALERTVDRLKNKAA